ncbi:transmembrane protein 177 [Lamellibrachia satsuma]|nr:transmembrane protein 177 [Lamellibrachia satsuma]
MAHILDRLGQRNFQMLVGAGIGFLFGASLVPQTLLLGKYHQVLASYRDGDEEPVSADMLELKDKIVARMDIRAEEEVALKLFTCFGCDVLHRGCLKLRTGAIVGIPASFAYKQPDDVDREKLIVNEKEVNWSSDAGTQLLESLVLSKDAKAFAIAREIGYANTYHLWADAFLKCIFAYAAYATGFGINTRFQMRYVLKTWGRIGMYATIATVYGFLYLTISDTYYCKRDNRIDRKTAHLNAVYARGGVEYYEKTLQRNRALRALMGDAGTKLYTVYGNPQHIWRQPHVSPTTRRDNLVRYFREHVDKLEAAGRGKGAEKLDELNPPQ